MSGMIRSLPDCAPPPDYSPDRYWGAWRNYAFNFNGQERPALREINRVQDAGIWFDRVQHLLCYVILEDAAELAKENELASIEEPLLVLTLSTVNSAHAVSELLSFATFYNALAERPRVAVSTHVVTALPYLYQMAGLLIGHGNIVVLDATRRYRFRQAWFRRNSHFNVLLTWHDIAFEQSAKRLRFTDLEHIWADYADDPTPLRDLARQIGAQPARAGEAPIVMLAKTTSDAFAATPQRAITLTADIRHRLVEAGIRVLSIGDFADVQDYVGTLFRAKIVITSYGGATCTNRFFLNPAARVVVICNGHYRGEYAMHLQPGDYWHVRHSHLCPVREQIFLLDHADTMTAAEADELATLARQLLAG